MTVVMLVLNKVVTMQWS